MTTDIQFIKLNNDFDAEPNAPETTIEVHGTDLSLNFFLNPFIWDNVEDGEKGKLTFLNVIKYRFGSANDEGFGRFRYYKYGLEFYDFYLVNNSDWRLSFPEDQIQIQKDFQDDNLNHYIFFFRDGTFECIASNVTELERIPPIKLEDQLKPFEKLTTVRVDYLEAYGLAPAIVEPSGDKFKIVWISGYNPEIGKWQHKPGDLINSNEIIPPTYQNNILIRK